MEHVDILEPSITWSVNPMLDAKVKKGFSQTPLLMQYFLLVTTWDHPSNPGGMSPRTKDGHAMNAQDYSFTAPPT